MTDLAGTIKISVDFDQVRRVFSSAAADVLAERNRQQTAEGWTQDHDDEEHQAGQLAMAAACYIDPSLRHVEERLGGYDISDPWPWWVQVDVSGGRGDTPVWGRKKAWFKPTDRRRDLVKAAALLLAEIEMIDRQESRSEGAPPPANLGRFGHAEYPAADFCAEVQAIDNALMEGTRPAELQMRIERAMRFRVGGDLEAIEAKARLREIERDIQAAEAGTSAG